MRPSYWEAFLAGYATVRAVPSNMDQFLILEDLARRLNIMSYICGRLTLRLGVEPMENHDFRARVQELSRLLG